MAEYIAAERAFHNGRMVERGATVTVEDDAEVPVWAVKADEAKPVKAKAVKADTRPDDAIAASKAKTAGLSGAT